MCSKVTTPNEDPESLQADSSRKRARGYRAPTPKENTSPIKAKIEDAPAFTPLKLSIDQIFHIIKHQPWLKLPKTAKQDPDPLELGNCSFHDSRGHAILYYWALK